MPRRNNTPKHIPYVVQNCSNKVRYGTKQLAEASAQHQLLENDIILRTYNCPYCSGWHLTTGEKKGYNQ